MVTYWSCRAPYSEFADQPKETPVRASSPSDWVWELYCESSRVKVSFGIRPWLIKSARKPMTCLSASEV